MRNPAHGYLAVETPLKFNHLCWRMGQYTQREEKRYRPRNLDGSWQVRWKNMTGMVCGDRSGRIEEKKY